ncbi:MAG: extracellular solute-binding protein [Gammaproteobacteria bacterium]|nr:extracellular solute-binding protein [Gammaproteobacteria bacterium]
MKLITYKLCLLLSISVSLIHAAGAQEYPRPGWQEQMSPLASPDAYPGGEFSFWSGPFPKSFNYYLDTTVTSSRLFNLLFEKLLTVNGLTLEFEPGLAASWSVSGDRTTFEFRLDDRARWSDGVPVSARDVAWTYDAIMDPKNLTGPHKIAFERFYRPEVIDEKTIRFKAREVHWKNLLSLGTFHVLPSHVFKDLDFNKINFEFPVVSGPYSVESVREGITLTLKRRAQWWQWVRASTRWIANFDRLKFRFFAERENAFAEFKTGNLDYYPVYTASRWATETTGAAYDNNWIIKQEVYNYNPIGFQGFAMNLRREKFADLRVRLALAHLLDRERMNQAIMHEAYFLHRCYFEDLYDGQTPCRGPEIRFDKDEARRLLEQAGWIVNRDTGLLEKDGQPFIIHFLTRSPTSDKFLAIYQEDLNDVGIQLEIVRKDWGAWIKDMDEFNFDMTWAAWSASLFKDPESLWHSKEADRAGGQNITGYKNAEIDAMIDTLRTEFDIHKRHDIIRRIDTILANDIPYVLLWNLNYRRLLYWNKFGAPETVLAKFLGEEGAYLFWWYDEDSAADLEYARETDEPLPGRDETVVFDEVFQQ